MCAPLIIWTAIQFSKYRKNVLANPSKPFMPAQTSPPERGIYRSFFASARLASVLRGSLGFGLRSCIKSWRAVLIWAPNLRASCKRFRRSRSGRSVFLWEHTYGLKGAKVLAVKFPSHYLCSLNSFDWTHGGWTRVLAGDVEGKHISSQHQVTNTITTISHLKGTHREERPPMNLESRFKAAPSLPTSL